MRTGGKVVELNSSCFFTGHRIIVEKDIKWMKSCLHRVCLRLITEYGVSDFIAGGALGFDTVAADTVIWLRRKYDIRLHLYLPCQNQTRGWNKASKEEYNRICEEADEVRLITNGPYYDGCMQKRNRAMVDSARFGIAYCTAKRGGTYSTLSYAAKRGRKVSVITNEGRGFFTDIFEHYYIP